MQKRLIRITKLTGILLIALYLLANISLFLLQDKFLYFPQPLTEQRRYGIGQIDVDLENITVKTQDGALLKGWIVNKDCENAIYYFGGNGEEVSYMIDQVNDIENYAVILINYRGYGDSEGKASQKNLFKDAEEIYHQVQDEYQYSKKVIMGRSLGSGIALHLASSVDVDGLILVTPYDSMANLAKTQFPPIFPVGLLLHEKYESYKIASGIQAPTLILMAENDTIVPNKNTLALAKEFPESVPIVTIYNAGHNSISEYPEYWTSIIVFLDEI